MLTTVLTTGVLAVAASACAGEASADPELPPMVEVQPPEATTPVVDEEEDTTPESIVAGQIEDCIRYVPFAASTGNFYMNVIWDQAHRSTLELRAICVQMSEDDAAGLARISAEQAALDQFFAEVSKTTLAAPDDAGDSPVTAP